MSIPEGCQSVGPSLLLCEGRLGHGGPHGHGEKRWTDGNALPDPDEVAGVPVIMPPATGRGVVYAAGQSWRGVVTCHDDAVLVELLDVRDMVWPVAMTGDEHGPQGMVADPERPLEARPGRVVLPWAQVVAVVLADD